MHELIVACLIVNFGSLQDFYRWDSNIWIRDGFQVKAKLAKTRFEFFEKKMVKIWPDAFFVVGFVGFLIRKLKMGGEDDDQEWVVDWWGRWYG